MPSPASIFASHNRSFPFEPPSRPSQPGPAPHHSPRPSGISNSYPAQEDFFESLTSSRSWSGTEIDLLDDDLLGSFEDIKDSVAPLPSGSKTNGVRPIEVPRDGLRLNESRVNHARPPDTSARLRSPPISAPIHVNLPPRPSEISNDYAPPLKSPGRITRLYSFTGPSSPPLVPNAGRHIIFHPAIETNVDHSDQDFERSVPNLHGRSSSNGYTEDSEKPSNDVTRSRSPAHSKLFSTLATTTKLASKWKSVLEPVSAFSSTTAQQPVCRHRRDTSGQSRTALPIDVTHSTPFASAQRIAGSYIPPEGAPGYDPHVPHVPAGQPPSAEDREYSGTKLFGRREGTVQVLSLSGADKVGGQSPDRLSANTIPRQLREYLPPRQSLAKAWTLLCEY